MEGEICLLRDLVDARARVLSSRRVKCAATRDVWKALMSSRKKRKDGSSMTDEIGASKMAPAAFLGVLGHLGPDLIGLVLAGECDVVRAVELGATVR